MTELQIVSVARSEPCSMVSRFSQLRVLTFSVFTGTIHLMHRTHHSSLVHRLQLPVVCIGPTPTERFHILRAIHELLHSDIQKGENATKED